MAKIDIASLRREYRDESLDEATVDRDPFEQFRTWFEQAIHIEAHDPTAMTLATVNAKGQPSARVVLLKGYSHEGFVFFSNYGSNKARDLEENPRAAIVFWWSELDRQIRIQGSVTKTSFEESKAYFASRPRGSQISGMVSPQSQVVPNRQKLVELVLNAEKECEGGEIACPPTWGGYRLAPTAIEFWQGRPNRLHDRIRYRKDDEGLWIIERLAP